MELYAVLGTLGLADWVDGLGGGLATEVGERGEPLSVGERQLVALAGRTSPIPTCSCSTRRPARSTPALEVRLQRTLDRVTRGRIVRCGRHDELAADTDSIYGRLYESWLEQTRKT